MKKLLKISLILICFGIIWGFAPMKVYAEENPQTTEINYIKSIDISSLQTEITAGNSVNAQIQITYDSTYDKNTSEKLSWKFDGDNSDAKVYVSITSYDTNGHANISITGTGEGRGRIIFYGKNTEVTYDVNIKPYETVLGTIKGILSSSTVLVLIFTVAVTVIGRFAIKIFRFGVNYKSNFATVEQQEKFEKSIREELRSAKTEIQDNILKICLREIQRETKPLRDLQTMASSIERDREILNVRLDSIDQKYNEVRKTAENINQLEQKINRLQYGDSTSDVRRSGK